MVAAARVRRRATPPLDYRRFDVFFGASVPRASTRMSSTYVVSES
ncbi:MAG: hypothetical protein K0R60_906, partial [Microbacterium sp.]|nr:hypothetical protein [Microbacterium sp.]